MIVGMMGYARSGKDTVANYLNYKYGFVRHSFSKGVHEALMALDPIVETHYRYSDLIHTWGYEGAKGNPEVRRLLQRMGTEVGRNLIDRDIWVKQVMREIKLNLGQNHVITNVRYTNEATAVLDQGGVLLKVTRLGVGPLNDHDSERIPELHTLTELTNDGTLADLHRQVDAFYRLAVAS